MHKTSPTTQNRADRAMHFFEPLLCTFYLTNTGYIHVKDYIIKSGRVYYVPVGKGLINYKDYFNILFNEEHVISIETHALDSPSKVTYSQMSVDTIKEYEKEYNYDKH